MKRNNLIVSLLLLSTVLLTNNVFASAAYPYPIQMNQPDGTTITIILNGDENLSWAKTLDNFTLLYNAEGIYEYAILNDLGNLVPSGQKAHDISQRTLSEITFLSTLQKNLFFSRSQVSNLKKISDLQQSFRSTNAFPTTGNRKLLCILIGFTDISFFQTQQDFHNLFNQTNYGTYGSVKDYFLENSYGQFNLTVDVAGPYTASNTMAYYGGNDINPPHYDLRVRELVTEAVHLADPDVNYADYDNDNDGVVDGVFIIYAGLNEAEGGGANSIWPHAWWLWPDVTLDGKTIYVYACSSEFRGSSGDNMTGIGTICHEFGHIMGAPDFYDIDYATGGQYSGTGNWDLMANGNYNGDLECPAHFNPYTKAYLFGWSNVTTLENQAELTINNSAFNNDNFYRFNTNTAGEYFLMENKQQLGFDTEIPGHGLVIYHVHKDISYDDNINITHPQKFYPVCANEGREPTGTPASYGDINSMHTPFPGIGNRTEFTDATLPSSKSWAGVNTAKPIVAISEDNSNRTISFCFMGCPPGADFMADVFNPCTGTTVNFTDLSAYEPTSWAWSFNPATVTFTEGTNAASQNPKVIFNVGGFYTVTLTATNAYGSDAKVKTNYMVVYSAPVVSTQPADVHAYWGDNVTFHAEATMPPDLTVQWQRSIDDGATFSDLSGETSIDLTLSCVTLDMSGYQYRAVFTNRCGTDTSDPAVLTVAPKPVTAAITVVPNPQQYSDLVDITIEITNGNTCGEFAATGADIFIGTQFMGTVSFSISGANLTATLYNVALLEPTPFGTLPTGNMSPGDVDVTAVLSVVNSNFIIANPGTTLTITCEDAEVTYNGEQYFTANPNNGDFMAALSAFVVDDDDLSRGEIRNADVTFRENDVSGNILGTPAIPVGLIDAANFQEGFVTTDIVGTLNNAEKSGGGRSYTVWAGAGNYYCGEIETPVTVTIGMPGGEYVTGGGHINMTNSSGLYPGFNNAGKHMNFGLVMKWNKSGKNLQGKVNVIYRGADGFNYQIRSNAINSLTAQIVEEGGLTFNRAVISTKATFRKLTPNGFIDLGGNLSLVVTAWECISVNSGEFDRISVQLAGNGGSGIYFTSNWAAGNTIAQTLDGGKIKVGMANMKSAEFEAEVDPWIKVYPNPSSGPVTFEFQLKESSKVTLDIYSTTGSLVSRIYEGEAGSGQIYTVNYGEKLPAGVFYYVFRSDNMVKTGKFIRTVK